MSAAKNFARVFSAELEGVAARLIEVEVDINVGLHSFNIVGLADKALSEAKERVNAALKNSGVKPPNKENRRITVNLAPADVKKTGSQYDLAIAVGYLLATKQIKNFETGDKIFLGELALNGDLRPVAGVLNTAQLAKKKGFRFLFVAESNAREAAVIRGLNVVPIENFRELIDLLEGRKSVRPLAGAPAEVEEEPLVEISEIKGQENAKRVLTIAAGGGHNLLMVGPPGSGKTMLAQALVSILPPPSLEEAIEVSQVYSAAGLLNERIFFIGRRPFRSPHQTASPAAVIGGGPSPRPGEISLAHRGVLFLDELPEFRRDLLEALRQPLESGKIVVSRSKNNLAFPAKFTLVAAMNPCPCGFWRDPDKDCRCSAFEIFRYQKKISGPLLDRIDLQISVPRVKIASLRETGNKTGESDGKTKAKVIQARQIQEKRFKNTRPKIYVNAEMNSKQCDAMIGLTPEAEALLGDIFDKAFLSGRGYYRLLKTARTIADLEEAEKVSAGHLAEAFGYRVRGEE